MNSDKAGLVTYVQNNNTVLNESNYNEMDALVFAQMSYSSFESAYSDVRGTSPCNNNIYEYNKSVSVKQYARDILNSGQELSSDQRELLESVRMSHRYDDCQMHDFSTADTSSSQWAAYTVDIDKNTSVIAMRGTDGTTMGWSEDFHLVHDTDGTNAQNYSTQYLGNCTADNIYLAGHSKGGNDIVTAYVSSDASVRDRVKGLDNFDGPGNNDEIVKAFPEGYKELDDKLDNWYPEDSVIGLLLNDNPGRSHFVDSDVREDFKDKGILGEHDPFAFQIDENGFKSAQQTLLSKEINEALDDTVSSMSNESRANLANTIDKMGIPSMIAGKKDELPYRFTEEDARKALEMGHVPDSVIDKLAGPVATAVTVYNAFDTYKNLSDEEKDAVQYVASYLINRELNKARQYAEDKWHEFENYVTDKTKQAERYVDEKMKQVQDTYCKIADWAKEKRADLSKTINDFCNEIENTYNNAKRWVNDGIQFIRNGFHHNWNEGGYGVAIFTVTPNVLMAEANDVIAYQNQLKRLSQQIATIQSELQLVHAKPALSNVRKVIEREADGCKALGERLTDIAKIYISHEKNIQNNI